MFPARTFSQALKRSGSPPLPVLVTHGMADSTLPYACSGWVKELLSANGADVTFVSHNGGHDLGGPQVRVRWQRSMGLPASGQFAGNIAGPPLAVPAASRAELFAFLKNCSSLTPTQSCPLFALLAGGEGLDRLCPPHRGRGCTILKSNFSERYIAVPRPHMDG